MPSDEHGAEPVAEGERQIRIGGDARGNTLITGDGNVVIIQAQASIEADVPPADFAANPYRGLASFSEREADRFFGRENLTRQLWEALRSLYEVAPDGTSPLRLLPIVGPSGAGKSSVARAGLVAELARRPIPGMRQSRVAVLCPGAHPVGAMAAVLARTSTEDAAPVAKARELAGELVRVDARGRHDGLRRIAEALAGGADSPLILLVDQFEEIYSLCEDDEERDVFVDNLLVAAADRSTRVCVVLTLRSDFLGATQRHPELNAAIAARAVLVPGMSEAELRRAIAEPAVRAGHPIDPATVALLVSETSGRPGALPLLGFALTRIWAGMADGTPPAESLEKIGGVGGALAQEAQRLYDALSAPDRAIARRAFLSLVQLGEGTRDTRRRVEIVEIVARGEDPEKVHAVLRIFAQPGARLVTLAAGADGSTTAEVTHEALFEHWQALRQWLEKGRDDLRFQRRMAEAATAWDAAGRQPGSLWSAPDLDLLRIFHARAGAQMSRAQVDFYEASLGRARRGVLVRRSVTTAMLLLTLAAAAGVFFASQLRIAADAQRSHELAAAAAIEFEKDATRSFRLAEAAVGFAPTFDARRALWRAFDRPLHDVIASGFEKAAFSLDGTRIVTASADGRVEVRDGEGMPLRTLEALVEEVGAIALSIDGSRIAITESDGATRVWDSATGSLLPALEEDHSFLFAGFSRDSTLLAGFGKNSDSGSALLGIWDVETGKLRFSPEGSAPIAQFSPDSRRLLTPTERGARVWDVEDGELLAEFGDHEAPVNSAFFSKDGKRVVTASDDGTARIWKAESGERLSFIEVGGEVHWASFSHDGRTIATVSAEGGKSVLKIANDDFRWGYEMPRIGDFSWAFFVPGSWKVLTGGYGFGARIYGETTRAAPHLVDPTMSVAFPLSGHGIDADALPTLDGQSILSLSEDDATVRRWSVSAGSLLATLETYPPKRLDVNIGPIAQDEALIVHIAFAPDGRRVASCAKQDPTARIWSLETGEPLQLLEGHRGARWCEFSADGSRLVTREAVDDGALRVWDVATGDSIASFRTAAESSGRIALSPDGSRLSAIQRDGGGILWNVASGEPELEFDAEEEGAVTAIAFSLDGKRLAMGTRDGGVEIEDLESGATILNLAATSEPIRGIAFSADGTRILTSHRSEPRPGRSAIRTRVWDAEDGRVVAILGGQSKLSADGRSAVEMSDGMVSVWSTGSGELVRQLDTHTEILLDRPGSVAISPDGDRVVTIDRSRRVARLWDIETGRLLHAFRDAKMGFMSARFTPDGEQILTRGPYGRVRVWAGSYREILRQVNDKSARGSVRRLTEEERTRYGL